MTFLDAAPSTAGQATDLPPAVDALASAGMSDLLALPARPEPGPALPSTTAIDSPGVGWLPEVADFAAQNRDLLLLGAGAVAVLLGGIVLWRWWRRGVTHERVGIVAVALATAFAAEGMLEVARQALHLPWPAALGLFGMFEVVMLHQALLAKYKLGLNPAGNPRRNIRFVWGVAAASGVVASLNSTNVAEFTLRLLAPAVAAGIWWMSLTADGAVKSDGPSQWRWTPRRLLLALGAIEPGQRDIETVDRDRRIDQMTTVAHKLHHGSPRLARWRSARLRRLTLAADDAMVAEVRLRVSRVHHVEESTKPDAAPKPPFAEVSEPRRFGPFQVIPMEFPAAALAPAAAIGGGPNGAVPAGVVANGLAKIPATAAANGSAKTSAIPAATPAPTAAPSVRQAARQKRADDAAMRKVERLVAKNPNITGKQVAERLGLSERTASRYLSEARKNTPPKE